ncbi:anthranilate/para-aminobenzoate synthase component I [Microvirga lotononidis]|uniref:Anthranilate/para-aminobenzoate synthase component I n=1 Tax=Microvirga lotononidis TaxID=864069 RepID=I4Z3W3_9HYPH|nr:anthranilate/para-aminobenzoate synthase component I [Microvirga lotononidis]
MPSVPHGITRSRRELDNLNWQIVGCQALTATDVIAACFPGGSITGAPKIRAMEIITRIERCARQVYCGSIGYFGFDGTADTNIAIRTIMLTDGSAVFHAGSGITALSNPQAEYEETLAKAQRIFAAFEA